MLQALVPVVFSYKSVQSRCKALRGQHQCCQTQWHEDFMIHSQDRCLFSCLELSAVPWANYYGNSLMAVEDTVCWLWGLQNLLALLCIFFLVHAFLRRLNSVAGFALTDVHSMNWHLNTHHYRPLSSCAEHLISRKCRFLALMLVFDTKERFQELALSPKPNMRFHAE